jgi:uncharacterized phosphosugar-binding protein
MSARAYLACVSELIDRLGEEPQYTSILTAADAVADTIANGGRILVPPTTYCLHEESTGRAGGFMPVHVLTDSAFVRAEDCVLIGSPVGTSPKPIDFALEAQARGAIVIALTNSEFENDPRTLLEHPTRQRLHEVADIVVDVPGPFGDGVFDVPELEMRAIPHSGVTSMTAMWMIFSEALSLLRGRSITPRLWECVNIDGARARNAVRIDGYLRTGHGCIVDDDQLAP